MITLWDYVSAPDRDIRIQLTSRRIMLQLAGPPLPHKRRRISSEYERECGERCCSAGMTTTHASSPDRVPILTTGSILGAYLEIRRNWADQGQSSGLAGTIFFWVQYHYAKTESNT